MEHYSDIKKSKMLPFAATWMDLREHYAKWKKVTQRKTNTFFVLYQLYAESKK